MNKLGLRVKIGGRVGRGQFKSRSDQYSPSGMRLCRVCRRLRPVAEIRADSACKPCHAGQTRRGRYGVSQADIDALLGQQEGRCAICRTDKPAYNGWCVDHDHRTGAVRGLLCHDCNKGLGLFKDSSDSLAGAIKYLKG
jgi:hypothetical protein